MAGVQATRVRTFLIADVRGYTAFTQANGDEAAARLAATFAEIVREGVEARGGEVIELRGDEALAVFDSAREALRAAVDLQQTFAHEVAIDSATPLTVGIGLDAGEAVELEGGFRGGALNLAARLCSHASAGEVLASTGVAHLARSLEGVDLTDHGTVDAKGIEEPVPVMAASASAPAALAPLGGAPSETPRELDAVTPIIGRARDRRRLSWAWRRARCGAGSVIVVTGPSGIGKTRLAAAGAELPARDGAGVLYRSFAAGPVGMPALENGGAAYAVLDDLEGASIEDALAALRWAADAARGPVLAVVAFDDERASPELIAAARRTAGEAGMLRPGPLGIDAIRSIAALYLGDAVDLLPPGLLESSGGVPSRVHEAVGEWAHGEAARRLGEAASVAAAGRSDLRTVEQELASRVVDLQVVREQARLFGARLQPGEHDGAPYRGLASFGADDAEWFFGRERLVAELVARLAGATLLGVVGPSGSGKSSAVRAGLVPAIAGGVLPGSETWTVAVMRPGDHPLRELDRAVWAALPERLRGALEGQDLPLRAARDVLGEGGRLMLVVDQFEEVFTTCQDEGERAAFLTALTEAATDVRGNEVIVLALRADYYGRCASDPPLAELLSANQVLVGQMTADEYRRVIEQPALRAGVRVEPALTDQLVAEVVGEPGALPLLSTALLELWQQRQGRTLLLAGHVASGGVHGAVARLAEAAYGELDEDEQAMARAVLLRLAGPGEGAAVVRRRVPLADFDTDRNPAVAAVIEGLTARRLLTVSDGYVEVAHEALLREWPRFQDWLAQDRDGRRLHVHLAESAREWQERGREPGELYRGTRLATALDWTTQHNLELNELEREFVAASREQSQRSVRRLRAGLIAMAALLVLALIGGGVALVQRRNAQHEATVALARQLGAEAVSEPRVDRAMLLAHEAVNLDRGPQTEGSLLSTLLRNPSVLGTFTVPFTVRPLGLTLAEGGRVLVVSDNNGELLLFDTATHRQVGPPIADAGGDGGPTALSPDGAHVVTFTMDKPDLAYIDLRHPTAKPLLLPMDHTFATTPTGPNNPIVVNPDGTSAYMIWSAGSDPTGPAYVDTWNLASGARESVTPLPGEHGVTAAQMVGAPGHVRLITLTPTAAYTYAVPGFRLLGKTQFHVPSPNPYGALSADGRYAVIARNTIAGNSFDLIDLRTGAITADTANGATDDILFAPSGNTVVTTEEDREVQMWRPGNPSPLQTLIGHGGRVTGAAFSADGTTLYTSSLDGAVFEWNVGLGSRGFGRTFTTGPPRAPGDASYIPALAVNPSRPLFAMARDGRVFIGSTATGREVNHITASTNPTSQVTALAWSPDGRQLLVGWRVQNPYPKPATGHLEIYGLGPTTSLARTIGGPGLLHTISDVAWSPDGRTLAAITGDPAGPNGQVGYLYEWNAADGRMVVSVKRPQFGDQVAFSPDGRQVATSWGDPHVIIYDSRSTRAARTLNTEQGDQSLAYTHNGTLATGSWAGIVQLWNSTSGAELGHPTLVAPAPTTDISFDPSGDTFVTSGGSDGVPKLWTTSTLQQLGSDLPGDPGAWVNQAYTPDGRNIIVVSQTGRGWIWPATLGAWEQRACQVAGRNLTHEEWSRYVTGKPYSTICPGE